MEIIYLSLEKNSSKFILIGETNQLDQSFQVDLKVSAPPGCPDRLLSGVFGGWIYWMLEMDVLVTLC